MRQRALRVPASASAAEREQAKCIAGRWAALDRIDRFEPGGSRDDRLRWLRHIARDRWDLRCGRERDRIPTSVDLLPPAVADVVMALARAWGMAAPMPAAGSFGAAVVLGGFLPSTLNRSAAAAALLGTGAASFRLVVGLASRRPLPGAEHRQAVALGAADGTEADTMAFGLATALGVDPDDWHRGSGLREQVRGDGLHLAVTEVPMHADGSRPNTGESFEWLLRTGLLAPREGVLCVTTPLYWIQNHINLLTRLPQQGTVLVTAGGIADRAGDLQPVYRSQHYLQEIKAAIDALPALLAWARA
jgi:hypothetical protein